MRQMTDHVLEIIKGPKPLLGQLVDRRGRLNAAELTLATLGAHFQGRVCHLHTDGTFKLGVSSQGMPFFLEGNFDDYDVKNDGGNLATDVYAYSPGMPTGRVNAVAGNQGLELESTEFMQNVDYAINDPLSAAVSTGVAATMLSTSGKLTNASITFYGSPVVGVVSQAWVQASPTKNAHGRPVLRFYSKWLPKDIRSALGGP